jgi:hypothetical protein
VIWITALDFEHWAQSYNAKFEFPRLIRRLISATCSDIQQLNIPGGEHGFLPGLDGVVQCGGGNDFVPSGFSVWEFGTENQVTGKANRDYKKRTESATAWNKKAANFCFATPCRWTQCETWEKEKNGDLVWNKVHGIWSRHLETWIERVPWVAAHFAETYLNRRILGLRTIEMIWDHYANVPNVNGTELPQHFVVNGRERIRTEFLSWLTNPGIHDIKRIIRFLGLRNAKSSTSSQRGCVSSGEKISISCAQGFSLWTISQRLKLLGE